MSFTDVKMSSIDAEKQSQEQHHHDGGIADVSFLPLFLSPTLNLYVSHKFGLCRRPSPTTPTLTLLPWDPKVNPHTPKSVARSPTPMIPKCLCQHSVLGSSACFLPSSFRAQTSSSFSDTLLSSSPRFVFRSFSVVFVLSLLNQVPCAKVHPHFSVFTYGQAVGSSRPEDFLVRYLA